MAFGTVFVGGGPMKRSARPGGTRPASSVDPLWHQPAPSWNSSFGPAGDGYPQPGGGDYRRPAALFPLSHASARAPSLRQVRKPKYTMPTSTSMVMPPRNAA